MKRRELVRHLEAHGCRLKREGAQHSLYHNPATRQTQAVPRHSEVPEILASKILRGLSVPKPK